MQQSLFKNLEIPNLTIDEAAFTAQVSTATIRNWIKTGYLKKMNSGFIDENSFNLFLKNIAGNEKLYSRANKSRKDFHNHNELQKNIFDELSKKKAECVAEKYEANLSDSYKNKEGIYYTPQKIVEDMLPLNNIEDIKNKIFCDPCCGSGNFIMRALEIGFKPQNIYGFDIDNIAIEITKKRIKEKTGYEPKNIFCLNFLDYAITNKIKFDYIYTNPPWGKKIQKKDKEKNALNYGAGKSSDTSSLFFFASLSCLNKNGKLGFLLPEAFFNIASFEDARKKALELKIEKLIDYGKSFQGLITKAQAILLSNEKNKNADVLCITSKEKKSYRKSKSFINMPKSILNFYCNENDISVIEYIFSLPHISLKNNAVWALGIVTGNNKKYLHNEKKDNYIPVYKGSDITNTGIQKASNFMPNDFSLYQQVAPRSLYEAPEKIIYKFISSRICFFYDTDKRIILNSANMFILNKAFPLSYSQIKDLFNSKFMIWIFKNIFNTHKILRSDLECLPIHSEYFKNNKKFDENSYLEFLNLEYNNGTYRIKE